MKTSQSKYLPAVALFAVALLVRIIYFLQIRSNFPGWDTPILDMLFHDQWARRIAAGDLAGTTPFFRAPFYPYFVGALYSIFGPIYSVPILVQHLIGAFSCSLTYLFTLTCFDRRTARTAGILSLFYWVFIYFENELLLDSLLVPISIALIWLLIRAARNPNGPALFSTGLVFGLAIITRPNYLAFAPFLLIWMWFVFSKNFLLTAKRLLPLAIGSALAILPVTLHNLIAGGEFVLVSSQGGINFYIGNNQNADGTSPIIPELGIDWTLEECAELALRESGAPGKEITNSKVSSHFYGKAIQFIAEQPLVWSKLTLKKLGFFWNAHEIQNNRNLYFLRQYASVTRILPPLFCIVSPLSILGLLLIFRYNRRYHIIGLFVIVYMLTVVMFFVNARFRLPVLPFLIILASIAFWKIFDMARERKFKKLAPYCGLLLLLFPLTNIDFPSTAQSNFSKSYYSLGVSYLQKGLLEKALDEFDRAIRMNPGLPFAHFNKGLIHHQQNNPEMARKEFELELDWNPHNVEAHMSLSILDRAEKRYPDALAHIQNALKTSPGHPRASVQEILVLELAGRSEEAYARAENLVIRAPDYPPGHYLRGRMLFHQGRFDLAEEELQWLTRIERSPSENRSGTTDLYKGPEESAIEPDRMMSMANFYLGMMRLQGGRPELAVEYFEKSVEISPDQAEAWSNLGLARSDAVQSVAAHDRAIQIQPENPIFHFNKGMTLARTGDYEKGRESLLQAIALNPDFEVARERIKMLEAYISASP